MANKGPTNAEQCFACIWYHWTKILVQVNFFGICNARAAKAVLYVHCTYLASAIKSTASNWLLHGLWCFELSSSILVPKWESAIGSNSGQCTCNSKKKSSNYLDLQLDFRHYFIAIIKIDLKHLIFKDKKLHIKKLNSLVIFLRILIDEQLDLLEVVLFIQWHKNSKIKKVWQKCEA